MKPNIKVCKACVYEVCEKQDIHNNSKVTRDHIVDGIGKPQIVWDCKALVKTIGRLKMGATYQDETEWIFSRCLGRDGDVPDNCPYVKKKHGAFRKGLMV